MKTIIPLFFSIVFILSNALEDGSEHLRLVEFQLVKIHEAAESADTIEELNELIYDHKERKFESTNATMVWLTKNWLWEAQLDRKSAWLAPGYIGAMITVKLDYFVETNNRIELVKNKKSPTGYAIREISLTTPLLRGCDLLCIYEKIFGYE